MAIPTLSIDVFTDGSINVKPLVVEPVPAPAYPFLARVKHRWQTTYGDDKVSRPETYKSINDKFIQLKPDMQWLWMNVNCVAVWGLPYKQLPHQSQKDQALQWWKSLTAGNRCFTNDHGWDNGYRDVVIPKNKTAPKYVMQENLVLGGNVVKVLAKTNGNYLCECLNVEKPIPISLPRRGNEHLLHVATIINQDASGTYSVNPFPQFSYEALYFYIGDNDYNLLPEELLDPLPPGAPIPSPFWP